MHALGYNFWLTFGYNHYVGSITLSSWILGVHLRLLGLYKTGQPEKADHVLKFMEQKLSEKVIFELFMEFNDEISRKFGPSYVIKEYFPTWDLHFDEHSPKFLLLIEFEKRLKIFAAHIGKNITWY